MPLPRAGDVGGIPQSEVEPLVRVCDALGLKLQSPHAPWPGYGKVVHLKGGRSICVNRKNADVHSSKGEIAAWEREGLGTVRPGNGTYFRVMLDGSGPGV